MFQWPQMRTNKQKGQLFIFSPATNPESMLYAIAGVLI